MPRHGERNRFHWPLLIVVCSILGIGLLNLFSAAYASSPHYFFSQLAWTGVAVVLSAFIYVVDYRVYERLAYILFVFTVVCLIGVFFFRAIGGSHRWLLLGPLRFQPSELMKLAMVLMLARYFHHREAPQIGHTIWQIRGVIAALAIPLFLVLIEPDLGTTLLLGAIAFSMLLFVKIRLRTLIILTVIGMILSPIAWNFVLKPYQKQRIMTMVDPESDPLGSGYHRRQSIIAIGSGQTFGKGFQAGTQTQLRFLPEQHTDFIFSVWAEEWGFVGAITLLILYLSLILCGIHIASKAREKFGALAAMGATSIIFWHLVVNIGMVLGLLPVVGVTLPLMSYGGTSLVITLMSIGLLLNIYARRRLF